MAGTGVARFVGAFLLFMGYTLALGFLSLAVMQPLFPGNVGIWLHDGVPVSLGGPFRAPADYELVSGYWIIPFGLAVGLVVLLVTHRAARRWLASIRRRGAVERQF